MGRAKDKTITTAKLHKLLAKDGTTVGTYLSTKADEAKATIITPDRTYIVTVIDSE